MRRTGILAVVITLASSLAAIPSQASAASLGSSLEQVKAEYQQAEVFETTSQTPELRLRDVSYAGIQWTDVQFNFDRSRHLRSMRLKTRTVSYSSLLEMVTTQADDGDKATQINSESFQPPAMQIRVCDEGDGSVSLTYEPISTPA